VDGFVQPDMLAETRAPDVCSEVQVGTLEDIIGNHTVVNWMLDLHEFVFTGVEQ
jgi:hypothetical protein